MQIDRSHIGFEAPPVTVEVERGRLRLFCKAIGETSPVFTDAQAARVAGHRDIIAPPTFVFCLETDRPDGFSLVQALGLPLARLLHGAQTITHHQSLSPGDKVVLQARVHDIYDKKNGELTFVVIKTVVNRCDSQEKVAELERTLILRN